MNDEPFALPREVLARFRSVGFQRLDRIDEAWRGLAQGTAPTGAEQVLHRELHTLKGDARVVGFSDVGALCQRLEEVLAAAHEHRYRVHEDVDIVVTMAIQFIGMLLRRKPESVATGIDLDGFLQQMDAAVTEWLRRSSAVPPPDEVASGARNSRLSRDTAVDGSVLCRLARLATTVYLEHLRLTGAGRYRLREVYTELSRMADELTQIPIAPYVMQHAAAATQLAHELGKAVDVRVDVDDVRVRAPILDAANVAVLHVLRNAVDHGIEPPDARSKKPRTGTIRIYARTRADFVELKIEDDGRGIDLQAVRARAVERGLVGSEATPSDSELAELVFHPGFSTRRHADAISGRGVGLDAVRAEVTRVKGSIVVTTESGRGTSFVVRLPHTFEELEVYRFRAARASLPLAVEATWDLRTSSDPAPCATELLDLPADADPSEGTSLELSRGSVRTTLLAFGPPRRATVRRPCPTTSDDPLEIVTASGEEVLLLRPEVLAKGRVPPSR